MTLDEFSRILKQTLADRRLSRGERQALAAVIDQIRLPATDLDRYRQVAFELARETVTGSPDQQAVFGWLEDVVRLLRPAEESGCAVKSEAWFSPGDGCRQRIRSLFAQARHSADVCVFTITDNEISEAIAGAHHRGVRIRLLTDNDKALDEGSDIQRLLEIGVDVREDTSPHHMHHKFAIFDGATLLTGSYNWTRSAAEHNEENLIVTGDGVLLKRFQQVFDELWIKFAV